MSPDEKARPRREARDGQELVESHRHFATTDRRTQRRVSVAGHQVARRAIRAAYLAVSFAAGKTARQIAAEIAARAVASLRHKGDQP